MSRKLIIDGNAVYELDEDCMLKKKLGEIQDYKDCQSEQNRVKNNLDEYKKTLRNKN